MVLEQGGVHPDVRNAGAPPYRMNASLFQWFWNNVAFIRAKAIGGQVGSDDLVEPADRGAFAGPPERLELVVPRLAEQPLDLSGQVQPVPAGAFDGCPQPVFRDQHVTVDAGHGMEDPQGRRTAEPGALGPGAGLLGDLEPEVHPAAQR